MNWKKDARPLVSIYQTAAAMLNMPAGNSAAEKSIEKRCSECISCAGVSSTRAPVSLDIQDCGCY
jgi:hypothetical protein